MDDIRGMLHAYLRQQKEMGMPDYVLSAPFAFSVPLTKAVGPAAAPAAVRVPSASASRKRENGLVPAAHLHGKPAAAQHHSAQTTGADPVRDALVTLYNENKTCTACGLFATRRHFVFGSGNAHARLMVVGEAPGADEDEQGLPFVGKAGELLTKMLSAVKLDRKEDAFIANVLKCRPPENRTPDSAEVRACKHILLSQIDIIKPHVILLLGRIAAHCLLDTKASIAVLRTQEHRVAGIPAYVTYHPASLLRNEEYKRPAWEDMQKLKRVLTGMQDETHHNDPADADADAPEKVEGYAGPAI
jgi:uracil-DNA glycosylase family 4